MQPNLTLPIVKARVEHRQARLRAGHLLPQVVNLGVGLQLFPIPLLTMPELDGPGGQLLMPEGGFGGVHAGGRALRTV
ncbi:MAG: hypothetical protein DLM66_07315 [Candidatus Dormiibacter spiritus]|nr:MAG: hypothetical protein DLM66_07315 [Candidatus Dormibacteraeota bacterium]